MTRLGVAGALVDGRIVPGDVAVAGGRIVAVGLGAPSGQRLAVAGFVDLQVNGFAGVDLSEADADGYRRAGEALLATGVTAYQPTFITAPLQTLTSALREVGGITAGAGPKIIGAHVEGPFLSPARLGTHPLDHRRDPDLGFLQALMDAGPVTTVTLAPERPGAAALIRLLTERGVVVSAGHSDATAAEAHAAFDLGVRTVTHLFNAMRPFSPRDPGIVGAALARDDVVVQLIVDGHHLAAETVRMAWRAARHRCVLVTDAVAAAGVGDGHFRLGSVDIEVRDGVVRRADGTLAGSTLTMIDAVRNTHALGVGLEEALLAVTATPASVLGRSDLGALRPGAPADVVVLDDNLEIRAVHLEGQPRFLA